MSVGVFGIRIRWVIDGRLRMRIEKRSAERTSLRLDLGTWVVGIVVNLYARRPRGYEAIMLLLSIIFELAFPTQVGS